MIRIVEVGPRDGLQNEAVTVPTPVKVALVNALGATGVDEIEVSAFVSPQWVPQLGDAAEVFAKIVRRPGILYSALVPNSRGLDAALAARVDKIALFTAASETFNRHNINATIAESIERFRPVMTRARGAGLLIRGYVSTAFWCPYEGRISPEQATRVIDTLLELGVDEVSIGDTIGKATTEEVEQLLTYLLPRVPTGKLALHFHDTYGNARGNVLAAWKLGIETFDSSVGGLGGCPFAPGSAGNVGTETLVRALAKAGAKLRVDLNAVVHARNIVASQVALPDRLPPFVD